MLFSCSCCPCRCYFLTLASLFCFAPVPVLVVVPVLCCFFCFRPGLLWSASQMCVWCSSTPRTSTRTQTPYTPWPRPSPESSRPSCRTTVVFLGEYPPPFTRFPPPSVSPRMFFTFFMYQFDSFSEIDLLFTSCRGCSVAPSAGGHAGSSGGHHGASVVPGRGPWRVLWASKVAKSGE